MLIFYLNKLLKEKQVKTCLALFFYNKYRIKIKVLWCFVWFI